MRGNRFFAILLTLVICFSVLTGGSAIAYAESTKQEMSGGTAVVDLHKLYGDAGTISPWAYAALQNAVQNGVIAGSNGKLNPKSNITRAEFTKILVSVLAIPIVTGKASAFTDISSKDWFYPYANAAYEAGIVTGYNQQFQANENITREQMASTISRALGLSSSMPSVVLNDSHTIAAWAKADVATVVALDLMAGYDNRFNPRQYVTREMAIVVAMRAYDYKDQHKPGSEPEIGSGEPTDDLTAAVRKQIEKTAAYMLQTITDPVIASIGGDWTVFGLARANVNVPDAYYTKYYANVEKTLKEKSGVLHRLKYTEYDRVILALSATGKGIEDVAGYNLSKPLADYETVIKQGINGPIFALIALDSRNYEIPIVPDVKTQTTREKLVTFILNREIAGGGWALGEKPSAADPDLTSMAIQGLTPYYKTNAQVKAAVDRAVVWLSKAQKADGGYASWQSINSESIAQVIVALSGLGIDPATDARFIKNGHSALSALLSFAAPAGGFYHIKAGGVDNGGAKPGDVDPMATDQAFYALVAYERLVKGLPRLYDLTDVQ